MARVLSQCSPTGVWPVPGIFQFLQEKGKVSPREMYRVFNMGIGLVIMTPADVDLAQQGGVLIGEVTEGEGKVALPF